MKNFVYTLFAALISLQIGTAQQLCAETLNISLDFLGDATVTSEMLLQGNIAEYSGLDWTNTVYTCDDIGIHPYTISGSFQGAPFTCSGNISVEDKAPPVAICAASAVVMIPPNLAEVTLDVNAFDNGSFDNCELASISIDPTVILSSQVGTNVQVTLTATDIYGNWNTCWTDVTVLSGTSSLACMANVTVIIENGDPVTLFANDFLVNSDPLVTTLGLIISDSNGNVVSGNTITTSEIGGNLTYEVTDLSTGNSCWGTLTVSGVIPGEGNSVLACNDQVNLSVPSGQTVTVTADMILEGGPYDYTTLVVEVADQNFNPIPTSPEVDASYAGQTLLTTVTDTVTNNSCWGTLIVGSVSGFFICDTESRCTDIGDCSTGHSDTDHVEWPCHLDLFTQDDVTNAELGTLIQPSNLVANFNVDELDIQPNIIDYDSDLIAFNYNDQIFVLTDQYKILRTWTVLNWSTGNAYTYVQIIKLNFQAGPIECNDNVVVSLTGFDGTASLYPENFVNVNSTSVENLEFYPSEVSCDDVGVVAYLVSGTYNGEDFICQGTFIVEEKFPPIAICYNLINVSFAENQDVMEITPDMIDAGSFDVCSDVALSVEPSQITSDQIGTLVNVTLTVVDEDGNSNYCIAQLAIQGEGQNTLACISTVTVLPSPGLPVQLFAEDLLLIPFNGVLELVITDDADNVLENNLISSAYAGQNLTYVLTDPLTGNSCWGAIQVATDNSNPGLACCSGLNYYIVTGSSIQVEIEDLVSPGSLALNLSLVIFDEDGSVVENNVLTDDYIGQAMSFTVTDLDTGNTCWATFNVEGSESAFFICDTDPRCTPFNDCDNGHSSEDHIEWPCDVEIFVSAEVSSDDVFSIASPGNLELAYGVNVMDAYPTLINHSGDGIGLVYEDIVINGAEVVKIIRTWTLLNWFTGELYEYVQIIKLVIEATAETEEEGITENVVLSIYPNPTTDAITIMKNNQPFSSNAVTTIRNILGRVMVKQAYSETLDISHFDNGTYYVTVNDSGVKTTKTFIKN